MVFDLNDLDKGSAFFYIDEFGRDHEVSKEEAMFKIAGCKYTVKVEGMEHLVPGATTVHCFCSPKGAASFPYHTDDVDLEILCIQGVKDFDVDGKRNILEEGQFVIVKKGVRHRGINNADSVVLSIQL